MFLVYGEFELFMRYLNGNIEYIKFIYMYVGRYILEGYILEF